MRPKRSPTAERTFAAWLGFSQITIDFMWLSRSKNWWHARQKPPLFTTGTIARRDYIPPTGAEKPDVRLTVTEVELAAPVAATAATDPGPVLEPRTMFAIAPRTMASDKDFTDRLFASRARAPSGNHECDRRCAELRIEHRLTPPKSPQIPTIPICHSPPGGADP